MYIIYFTGPEFKLWFAHTLQQQAIDGISDSNSDDGIDDDLKKFTLDEFRSVCQKLNITHMHIDGDIPTGLHELTPDLKQLKLRNIPRRDQLQQ